jgi:uncharacterized repeat protein (TIGR03803 family)
MMHIGERVLIFGTLLTMSAAFGADLPPKVAFTFICSGDTLSQTCPNGASPSALIQASNGVFYGTTGSTSVHDEHAAGGSIISLTAAGNLEVLHRFTRGSSGDYLAGDGPTTLIEAGDGNLYGTTTIGGKGRQGVLFRIAKNGQGFRTLHSFCSLADCADGARPVSLALGPDGDVYGVTVIGGSNNTFCHQFQGCGTLFRYTPNTGEFSVLTMIDGSSGALPGSLIWLPMETSTEPFPVLCLRRSLRPQLAAHFP